MTRDRRLCVVLACGWLLSLASHQAWSQQPAPPDEERRRIEQKLDELKALKADLDARIDALTTEVRSLAPPSAAVTASTPTPTAAPPIDTAIVTTPPIVVAEQRSPTSTDKLDGSSLLQSWGRYEPGKGFVLLRSPNGEVSLSLIAYVRYLNQLGLDDTYTDSFGRTKTLDRRQDVLLNKVNLTFKGWLFDPNFTYRIWIWTNQPVMGQTAQVVVGGQFGYTFSDLLNIYGGVAPLPSTRSTNWSYPFWLKMDNRTLSDEFFRASYTFGFWADGQWRDFGYRAMIANNLSALGVDAGQLDSDFATLSGALWWMPTTGEFGPNLGFGDYEYHDKFATLLGVHYTRSREDSQSQPNANDFENSQIRLSDGTQIFQPGAFGTDGQIRKATYQMLDVNAGFKYRGWSLEGEYYFRWVGDFQTVGIIPVTSLFDHGFQLQASTMLFRDLLQVYASGSKLFGQYGNPWDLTVGLNLYPFLRREMHINMQGIYMRRSPVGGLSYPYQVGGNGWIFNTDIIVTF